MVRVPVVMGLREELTLTTTTTSSNCFIIRGAVGIVAWGLDRGQILRERGATSKLHARRKSTSGPNRNCGQ
jgi:hypothetical protein